MDFNLEILEEDVRQWDGPAQYLVGPEDVVPGDDDDAIHVAEPDGKAPNNSAGGFTAAKEQPSCTLAGGLHAHGAAADGVDLSPPARTNLVEYTALDALLAQGEDSRAGACEPGAPYHFGLQDFSDSIIAPPMTACAKGVHLGNPDGTPVDDEEVYHL